MKKQFSLLLLAALCLPAAMQAESVSRTFYLDFGDVNPARGGTTEGADVNGHYWTNVKTSGNNYIYPGTVIPMVTSDNQSTTCDVLINVRFMSNGTVAAGGLENPSADLLGDLAVASATNDYLFVEDFQDYNFVTFRGLDLNKAYRFHAFGSRANDAVRIGNYQFRGLNEWDEDHQMSGAGCGADGYNGNNNHVSVSDPIFPDENGNITFTIRRVQGMCHINAMKIEELDMERPAPKYTLRQAMYIDFGGHGNDPSRGSKTIGADANGNYWNNFYGTEHPDWYDRIPVGASVALVNSKNEPSGITATTSDYLLTNGGVNGGVTSPTVENLGDLAIATATTDYVYVELSQPTVSIEFSGVDPTKAYRVHAFGSRITNETGDRWGYFRLDGNTSWRTRQDFSGRCIGGRDEAGKDIHGNVRNVAVSDYIFPDANGKLTFTIERQVGLSHLNVLKLEEFDATEVTEPVVKDRTFYLDFGDVNPARGGTTEGADINGNYWTNVKTSGNNYIYPGTVIPMVTSDNQPTTCNVLINVRFMSNGTAAAGGLENPSADLLGDLAVASATNDYLFIEDFQDYNFVTFRGLDLNKAYRFHAFGSRATDAVRMGNYQFRGLNEWNEDHQMSGAGCGVDGYNGNNNHVSVSDPIFPDENGNITFTIRRVQGMCHINAMKIEELDMERPAPEYTLNQAMYIDFGEHGNDPTRGSKTLGADANGNYWNNFYGTEHPDWYDRIPAGTFVALVNSKNEPSGITATTSDYLLTNGGVNGGVTSPTVENLGDLAIATATTDYVYVETSQPMVSIEFSGVDPKKAYRVHAFGSRITNETGDRWGYFRLDGNTSWRTRQDFSGRCIGGRDEAGKDIHGNVRNVAVSDYIFPDANGKLTFTIEQQVGLSHLNVLKLEEFNAANAPEPVLNVMSLAVTGSAVEEGGDVEMTPLSPTGTHTGKFVAYLELNPGSYSFTGVTADDETVSLGDSEGSLKVGGVPYEVTETQIVRLTADTRNNTLDVLPITSLAVKGVIVPDGTTLDYVGRGVWRKTVTLDKTTTVEYVNRTIYFAFNGNESLAVKRVAGTSSVAMPSQGYAGENIRLNNGTYELTLDMATNTFAIDAEIDPYRISVFGSSVANGQGAANFQGYAYNYGEQLKRRTADGLSQYPLYTSGISIGGNTTTNLLNRYDDLTHDFGHFVMIGLSLGNEGIHGAAAPETVFAGFRDNMLRLIADMRADGKYPVVVNNYTRGDYNDADYGYVKRMNLLIHEWDLPSVNVLGAIDDGAGHWASGYIQDVAHPNLAGHNEFLYAIVPSLFDAVIDGKELPVRDMSKSYTLGSGNTFTFTGEETVHPFTIALRVKGDGAGRLITFRHGASQQYEGYLEVDNAGRLVYHAPIESKGSMSSAANVLSDGEWHNIILTHYHAWGRTFLYVDNVLAGTMDERLTLGSVTIGDANSSVSRDFSEVLFWRSALNAEEVAAHNAGSMLKSSLEIYSPMEINSENVMVDNKAQSLNAIKLVLSQTDGVEEVSNSEANSFEVTGGYGFLTVTTNQQTDVTVCSIDGKVVYAAKVNGQVVVDGLSQGVYLVNNHKVVVK